MDNARLFIAYEFLKENKFINTYTELASVLKTNKSGINDLKTGKKKVSVENIQNMINSYSFFSAEWLLTGKGSMLKDIEIYNSGIDTISERLAYFKTKNGLTYNDLGNILGLTSSAMYGIIKRNEVTEEQIIFISEKFGITKEWFLTGRGKTPEIKNKEIKTKNINDFINESTTNYLKENNKITILEKENEFLKETNSSLKETVISLRDTNKSIKEINELLKNKIKDLESDIENFKNYQIK